MKESLLKKKQKLRNNEYYGMQDIFDNLHSKSKGNYEFSDLMKYIISENNILLAYRNIKRNDGSVTVGTDGLNINYFEKMDSNYFVKYIQRKLQNYYPKSVRRVDIPKEDGTGRTRPLGIPCIEDRIIQQCIKQVLEPICEAKFHKHSYGFRPNRSTGHAIARCNYLMWKSNLHYVVDIDIKGFFDNVNHSKLKKQIWNLGIQDKNLISILGKIVKSEIQGVGIPTKGTPQGGLCKASHNPPYAKKVIMQSKP
ncbi:reverse transcriptase domain-containing protein [Clostridium kluyveri]|uniref:reverse transcriptase domain-containing protein n=1 Tax=Clostridium kluyveri TaxID=1534 RepID=UPI000B079A01